VSRTLLLGAVLLGCAGGACGSSTTAPVIATPSGPVANLAGSWTGTFESANFPTRPVSMVVVQTTNCVDGAWITADSNWHGAISGLASIDALPGFVSFERTSGGGGACDATSAINATITANTLRLTAETLTPVGACSGDLPRQIVMTLHR
jgi:hypothetical protein